MAKRDKPLYRHEIRQRYDRPTGSTVVEYVGNRLSFHTYIYGYPEGVFFAVSADEIPYPPDLQAVADEMCVLIDSMPEAKELREAVVEALAAEAMRDAPDLLGKMASPRVYWLESDGRTFERRHMIALKRVDDISRSMQAKIKMRDPQRAACPPAEPPLVVDEPAPTAGMEWGTASEPDRGPHSAPEPASDLQGRLPTSTAVQKAQAAIQAAREAELPQRLPGGARRELQKQPPAVYIAEGSKIDPRANLQSAMTDGQAMGGEREAVVIDWDGEWPVVVRRYGKQGRIIYRVEEALRRAGVDVDEQQEATA